MEQTELIVALLIIMTGFVSSGVLGSFYQVLSDKPIGFAVNYQSIIGSVTGVFLCVFAGPFIIMRNTIRGRRIEGRAFGWVVAASALATLWSFFTGIVILQFVFAFSAQLSGLA